MLYIALHNQEYGAGRMLTGEVKKRLTEVLTDIVERHRKARVAVTDEASKPIYLGFLIYLMVYHLSLYICTVKGVKSFECNYAYIINMFTYHSVCVHI